MDIYDLNEISIAVSSHRGTEVCTSGGGGLPLEELCSASPQRNPGQVSVHCLCFRELYACTHGYRFGMTQKSNLICRRQQRDHSPRCLCCFTCWLFTISPALNRHSFGANGFDCTGYVVCVYLAPLMILGVSNRT